MISKINFNTQTKRINFGKKTQFAPQNPSQSASKNLPVTSFEQYLTGVQKFAWSAYIALEKYEYDFDNVKHFVLGNNLKTDFDPCWKNSEVCGKGILTLAGENKNNAAAAIVLSNLLDKKAYKFSEKSLDNSDSEYPLTISFCATENNLEMNFSCDHSRTQEGVERMIDFLLNPDFSEKNLQEAKTMSKRTENDPEAIVFQQIFKKEQTVPDKSIDSVTLDDVKKLYADFLSKAQGKFTISMPEPEYKISKDAIFASLSKLPVLKVFDENIKARNILPITKSSTLRKNSATDVPRYIKHYTSLHNGSLKENIIARILKSRFDNLVYSIEGDRYFPDTNMLTSPEGFYIALGAQSSKEHNVLDAITNKQPSSEELKAVTEGFIKSLIEEPIPENELKDIKLFLQTDIEEEYENTGLRAEYMHYKYTERDSSLGSYTKTLNEITPKEVQAVAKKIFSSPCIETIYE